LPNDYLKITCHKNINFVIFQSIEEYADIETLRILELLIAVVDPTYDTAIDVENHF